MDEEVKKLAGKMISIIDEMVRSDVAWRECQEYILAANAEQNGNLEEFLSWFDDVEEI